MTHKLKQMWYADYGVGKTTLAGTVIEVPELMPALMIDFEGNTDSIESRCNYLGTNEEGIDKLNSLEAGSKNKIDVLRCRCVDRTFLGGELDTTGLEAYKQALGYLFKGNQAGYESIIIDSQTAYDYWAMNWIMKKYPLKSGRTNENIPEYPDFRKLLMMHCDTFYLLEDLPIHVFVTAQCQAETTKDGTVTGHWPRLTGQARQAVGGILKQVCYLRVNKTSNKRVLHFQPYGDYDAKDCSEGGKFGDKLEEPTLRKIYDIRYGG